METLFLEDPSYEIREKEMAKIHEVLSRNRTYEAKAIFLKKMVYALIDATKVVPKTDFSIPETHKGPLVAIEPEHLEFPRSKVQVIVPEKSYRTQITEIKSMPPPISIQKSPILLEKLQQRVSQNNKLLEQTQRIQSPAQSVHSVKIQTPIQPKIEIPKKPSLEEGIPIPSPPKSFSKSPGVLPQQTPQVNQVKEVKPDVLIPQTRISVPQVPSRKFSIGDLSPPPSPKLEAVTLRAPEPKIMPPKIKAETKTKEIPKPAVPQQTYKDYSIESLPDTSGDDEILKIRSVPFEEQKYMPPPQFKQEPRVDIKELVPQAQKAETQKSNVQPEVSQIQPTIMNVPGHLEKQAFEIEHHPTETEYKELEPVERRFIPLHQEIELTSTPIQRKAQSIMPPPPKPTGGQVAKEQSGTGVSFLNINPRSGVREVEGNIQYEVADFFSSPLQEVFEFIRLSVFVNPNKLNDIKFLEESFKKMSKQLNITIQDKDKKEIISKVNEHINGFGKIKDMLSDPSVSGIYCTGLNRPISVDFKLIGKISTNVVYVDKLELERLIKNMARMAAKSISEANPILEATIPPNIKVEATLGGDFISSKFIIKKL